MSSTKEQPEARKRGIMRPELQAIVNKARAEMSQQSQDLGLQDYYPGEEE